MHNTYLKTYQNQQILIFLFKFTCKFIVNISFCCVHIKLTKIRSLCFLGLELKKKLSIIENCKENNADYGPGFLKLPIFHLI